MQAYELKNELKVTNKELNLFRELIYKKLGIYYPDKKDYLLQSKLEKILRKGKYTNLNSLYDSVNNENKESFDYLTRFITTNHTFFFREKEHFKILREDIIKRNIKNPVIWSAACSTGEEVYSIVIELYEHKIYNFVLMATDIDKEVLFFLNEGIYDSKKLQELSNVTIKKYFLKCSERLSSYKVKEYLKNNLIIKKVNLVDNVVFEKQFDYIFCRNVMIYFDNEKRNLVLEHLFKNLKPSGYLFVGHSESLLNNPFHIQQIYNSVYRKN